MRILQITPYYLPHTGGIERYVYNLSHYLQSMGHNINILTTNIPKSLIDNIEDNVEIHRYPCKIAPLGNPIVFDARDLKSRIKQYDIIHIHGIYTFFALKTSILLRKYKQPNQCVIITHHGRVRYPRNPMNILVKLYEHIFVRILLKQVDTAVVLSQSDKDQLISLGLPESDIRIIPNGIDLKLFNRPNKIKLDEFRKKYSLNGKKIILFLAVISKRKGIFDLIHAFHQLESKNSILFIVGDGPDKEKALRLTKKLKINDRVIFTGNFSFENLLCAYSVADVYILPSYFEGMATTIVEALVLGTPVIATKIPGIKDNFADLVELVDAGNISELKEKINEMLNRKNEPALSRNTYKKLDIEYAFSEYINIYLAHEFVNQV